jgi:hypothetical protein
MAEGSFMPKQNAVQHTVSVSSGTALHGQFSRKLGFTAEHQRLLEAALGRREQPRSA